jgi:hypothetical protein
MPRVHSRIPEPDLSGIIDTARYPLEDPPALAELVARCRRQWAENGSFSLDAFLRPEALARCVDEIEPLMANRSYHHMKQHNIYFSNAPDIPEAIKDPAYQQRSSNHTLTADQLDGLIIRQIHQWRPLARFLEVVLDKPSLYPMADPMAGLNVMGYGAGDQIGWHFDRAEFTVTLLLRRPKTGGTFQYRHNLRSATDPNHDGVARLLSGEDKAVSDLQIDPGTLNVFAGYRSPHHVTPAGGDQMRLVAVLSFMEQPDVMFSVEDRIRFYGRAEIDDPVPGRA